MTVRRRRDEEHVQQRELCYWATLHEHIYPELVWLHAIPNGGARSKATAGKLKAEGVRAGVWDLFLPCARGKYHGMYIEMKANKNKLTPKQVKFRAAMQEQGYYMPDPCYAWHEAKDRILEYLNETA